MAAYVVLDIEVTHPDKFARYRELAPPAIAAYGGRYIARGGNTEDRRVRDPRVVGTRCPSDRLLVGTANGRSWPSTAAVRH